MENRLQELEEANWVATKALQNINSAIDYLQKSKNWGIMDILGSGNLISFIKREKISKANESLSDLAKSLEALSRDLQDVEMKIPSEISNTFGDIAWDIFLDNIFTDIRVQGEIKGKIQDLLLLKQAIQDIKAELDKRIENLTNANS